MCVRDEFVAAGVVQKLEENGTFTRYDLFPGVIAALGRERAARRNTRNPDPVWGDKVLDPLQFVLLSQSVLFSNGSSTDVSGKPVTPSEPEPREGFVLDQVQKISPVKIVVSGLIKDIVEVPTKWWDLPGAVMCASTVLYSYSFEVVASPTTINQWLIDPTDPDADPTFEGDSISKINATLYFEPLDDTGSAFLEEILGCEIPFNNPTERRAVSGKSVSWKTVGEIGFHGRLAIDPDNPDNYTTTDSSGRAYAQYLAGSQAVPPYLRVVKSYAPGWVWVKATGLVSGWSGLEAGVDLMYNPTNEPVQLNVGYYGPAMGFRYSGGRRIGSVNAGGYEYLDFPAGDFLTTYTGGFASWWAGGKSVIGSKPFSKSATSDDKYGSINLTLEAPASGIGTEAVVKASASGGANGGSGNISLITTETILVLDVLNPYPQKDLELSWVSTTFGNNGSYQVRVIVGKQSTVELVVLSGESQGTKRIELGSHEYIVVRPMTYVDAGTDTRVSAEITIRLVD